LGRRRPSARTTGNRAGHRTGAIISRSRRNERVGTRGPAQLWGLSQRLVRTCEIGGALKPTITRQQAAARRIAHWCVPTSESRVWMRDMVTRASLWFASRVRITAAHGRAERLSILTRPKRRARTSMGRRPSPLEAAQPRYMALERLQSSKLFRAMLWM
jgi:hypothetical protein